MEEPKDEEAPQSNYYIECFVVVQRLLHESLDRHSFLPHRPLSVNGICVIRSIHSIRHLGLALRFHDLCFICRKFYFYYMLYHLSASEIVCGQ